MSPMDLDKLAVEVRERIDRDEESAPMPWQAQHITMEEHRAGSAIYTPFYIVDAHNNYVAEVMSPTDVDLIVLARNAIYPLLDDRDRLKAEVAALEGILGDAATDSPDTARVRQLEARVRQLEARVRELEGALRPFAAAAATLPSFRDDGVRIRPARMGELPMADEGELCIGDLRHAAKAMEG